MPGPTLFLTPQEEATASTIMSPRPPSASTSGCDTSKGPGRAS
ncbi:hypothetical protein SAMN05216483_2334 [Streptomyces sp. 2131.1]|nr:hypothetical protein SAMN05216483_2334 [Streptomyces sp. 2131.1]